MKLIKLNKFEDLVTAEKAEEIYLNADKIISVRQKSNHSEIDVAYANGWRSWKVQETVEEIQYQLEDKPINKPRVGVRIKDIRMEKGMNQMQMAKFLNVSNACICNWEKGNFTPNRFGIKVITEKLGIDCSHLVRGKNNFYHLKTRLKQYSNEPMLPIHKSRYMDKLLDELKWAMITENTDREMRLIGAITRELMQHCFKRNFEFEACLSMAINQVNKE